MLLTEQREEIHMILRLNRRSFASKTHRRKLARQFRLEGLEERTLLTLNAINFPQAATVESTPVVMNGTLYFAANEATDGTQLWKSDGTATGTSMITDLNVKNGGIKPTDLTVVGNTLYFAANDVAHGTELWRSDGTSTGTAYVTDSNDGVANFGIYPSNLTNDNGTLYFTGLDLYKGFQVFTSDGTAAGTAPVTDINSGGAGASEFTPVGNLLYFQGYDPTDGYQLWDLNTTNNAVSMLTKGGPRRGRHEPAIPDRRGQHRLLQRLRCHQGLPVVGLQPQ